MEDKAYKVRVEVSVIMEISVTAGHEDEAAAIAERIAQEKLYYNGDIVLGLDLPISHAVPRDEDIWIPNYGVRAIEVEEEDCEQ